MIPSSLYKPRIFPIKGKVDPAEIDRAQAIDKTSTLNREKIEEIGNASIVGYIKKSPTIGYRLTQYEYGSIEFFQKLVNTATLGEIGETAITLNDFKTPYFDICAYLTDDDDTFKQTKHFPTMKTAGFSFSIGDPQAIMERSFDFVGEEAIIWQGDNKYFIYQEHDAGSAGDDTITLDNTAVVDPDIADQYMVRVVRVTDAGVTTVLSKADGDYTEDATTVTIATIDTDDRIKLYYTSSTAPTVQFTPNTVDPEALLGDSVDIYLYIPASSKPSSSDYIYRLQSVTLDVRFDRQDLREIGSKDVKQRGVRDTTVTVTLGRILEDATVEEVLRGVATGYGKIDVSKLSDEIALIIKVYSDNTKDTLKYGYIATGLSPTELRGSASVNEYIRQDATLEGEDLSITKDTTLLGSL